MTCLCGFADKMLNCLQKGISFVWHSTTKPAAVLKLKSVTCIPHVWRRHESNYNAYPTFDTPSPYKPTKGIRRFYEYKFHKGGENTAAFLLKLCICDVHWYRNSKTNFYFQ